MARAREVLRTHPLGERAPLEGSLEVAELREAAEDDLEIIDGEIRVVGAPQLAVKLGELARVLKGAPGYAFPKDIDPKDVSIACAKDGYKQASVFRQPRTSADDKDPIEIECYLQRK